MDLSRHFALALTLSSASAQLAASVPAASHPAPGEPIVKRGSVPIAELMLGVLPGANLDRGKVGIRDDTASARPMPIDGPDRNRHVPPSPGDAGSETVALSQATPPTTVDMLSGDSAVPPCRG